MDIELKQYLDKRFETLVTNDNLAKQLTRQTETLKAYTHKQTEKLAAIIATTIAEPMERNFSELKDYKTVREEVSTLKAEMQKIKTALQLN
jgi:hypothetical protein